MASPRVSRFKFLARPLGREARGLRFFSAGPHFYACDNSGENPDFTEDGPLRIVLEKPIVLSVGNGEIEGWFKVLKEREGTATEYSSAATGKEIHWMLDHLKMQWKWKRADEKHFFDGMVLRAPQEIV